MEKKTFFFFFFFSQRDEVKRTKKKNINALSIWCISILLHTLYVCTHAFRRTSQILRFVSSDPEARKFPLGSTHKQEERWPDNVPIIIRYAQVYSYMYIYKYKYMNHRI